MLLVPTRNISVYRGTVAAGHFRTLFPALVMHANAPYDVCWNTSGYVIVLKQCTFRVERVLRQSCPRLFLHAMYDCVLTQTWNACTECTHYVHREETKIRVRTTNSPGRTYATLILSSAYVRKTLSLLLSESTYCCSASAFIYFTRP